jgi:hypothetical protein
MSEALYEPFDGDYKVGPNEELCFFIDNLLGDYFSDCAEIAITLYGPEVYTASPVIRIEATWNLNKPGWEHDEFVPIPEGYSYDQIKEWLFDGYVAYFKPL